MRKTEQIQQPPMRHKKPTRVDFVREELAMVAIHEAGHVAAQAFTWHLIGHIQSVSIVPDARTLGRVVYDVPMPWEIQKLSHLHDPWKCYEGRKMLLGLFAGKVALLRAMPPACHGLLAKCNGDEQDMDLARQVADIIARPGMPARRVLVLAEEWAAEMIALPAVWRTVLTLARMLFDRGVIEDDEIMAVCDGILGRCFKLPKWRQRLRLTKTELKATVDG